MAPNSATQHGIGCYVPHFVAGLCAADWGVYPGVSAHTARHTFALAFLKQHPGKLVDLAALLGHETLDSTAIYTQPSQEQMADALETSSLNAHR